MNDITNATIIQWQNDLMKVKDDRGRNYSPTYLRIIHAQLLWLNTLYAKGYFFTNPIF